jgi:hypothetical protein
MRELKDFKPDTVMIVVQAAHPDYQPALYLPPKQWLQISRTPGGPPPKTEHFLAQVKRKLLDHLEKYKMLPLTPMEWDEQVFLLRDSCLSFKVTTLDKVEALLAELEESELRVPEEKDEQDWAGLIKPDTPVTTEDAGSDGTSAKPPTTSVRFNFDPKEEDLADEARALTTEQLREDPRYAETSGDTDNEEDDATPPWGDVPNKGPSQRA